MFRISKIIARGITSSANYLKGYNFLTNGEKRGSLTFYWGKKEEPASTDQLFHITG